MPGGRRGLAPRPSRSSQPSARAGFYNTAPYPKGRTLIAKTDTITALFFCDDLETLPRPLGVIKFQVQSRSSGGQDPVFQLRYISVSSEDLGNRDTAGGQAWSRLVTCTAFERSVLDNYGETTSRSGRKPPASLLSCSPRWLFLKMKACPLIRFQPRGVALSIQ